MITAHDLNHYLGSFYLTIIGTVQFKFELFPCAAVVMMLGIIWEGLDELNYKYQWRLSFLDNRGGDLKDLAYNLMGVITAIWVMM